LTFEEAATIDATSMQQSTVVLRLPPGLDHQGSPAH